DSAGDAAVIQREVVDGVERPVAEGAAVARRAPLFRLGREAGLPAVWRIDDERRLPEGALRVVVPERAGRVLATLHAVGHLLLARGPLPVGLVETSPELDVTLARDTCGVIARPDTLQIRFAPGRASDGVRDRGPSVVRRDHERRGGGFLGR